VATGSARRPSGRWEQQTGSIRVGEWEYLHGQVVQGQGCMRKQARDKGRGTLYADKEKARGRARVRAPRKKRRKPERGTPVKEDTAEEGGTKRKGER